MKKTLILCALPVLVASSVVLAATANQTLQNLNKAYAGEANAAHEYEIYAKKADEEGYLQASKLFRATAISESVHRDNHKTAILSLGAKPAAVKFEKVANGTTKENLQSSVKDESNEAQTMYPDFIRQANADNAAEAVKSFTYALNAEKEHKQLFEDALKNINTKRNIDYCVSKVTGNTVAVPLSQSCPVEPGTNQSYDRVIR